MARGGKRTGAGRQTGSKNKKTLERDAAIKAYQQLVLKNLQPLFRKQLLLAMGQVFVYRKEKHGTGASMRIEHVLLENPHEIADALDKIVNNDANWPNEDGFVYVSAKSPEHASIKDMLDRSIGKAADKLDLTSGGDKIVVPLLDRGIPTNNSTRKNTRTH